VVLTAKARENLVEIGDILDQHRNRFFLRHAMRGLGTAGADGFEQFCLVVAPELSLLDAVAKIRQTASLYLFRDSIT
jgi:hypothetical protein